jgi:ABC-type Fe3+ transport system permease subunit
MKEILRKVGFTVATLAVLSLTALGAAGTVLAAGPANAHDDICAGAKNAITGACEGTDVNTVIGWVGQITSWLLWAIGAVCVIFVIIGGVKYATSGGDAEKVKSAKNTLMYALIGLAIALLAAVIVSFVTNALGEVTGS